MHKLKKKKKKKKKRAKTNKNIFIAYLPTIFNVSIFESYDVYFPTNPRYFITVDDDYISSKNKC